MLTRIVSGGQTGVDVAGFDAAMACGIPIGGWVPKGRLNEAGSIPKIYERLQEAPSADPALRTELNIIDSDATLVIVEGEPAGGTALTVQLASQHGKPHLVIDLSRLDAEDAAGRVVNWLTSQHVAVLNVAGPRASEAPLIHQKAVALLQTIFARLRADWMDADQRALVLSQLAEAHTYMRHWDTIRWIVPFGYFTLAGAAYFGVWSSTNISVPEFMLVSGFNAGVGACSALLVRNTGKYHNRAARHADVLIDRLVAAGESPHDFFRLPFSMQGRGMTRTATFWFAGLVVAVAVASLAACASAPWWYAR